MNNTQKRTARIIAEYKPHTKQDVARLKTAIERLNEDIEREALGLDCDCGLYGKVKEILSHSDHSKITDVRKADKDDNYIFVDEKRYPLEEKSNYTDIEKWINKPIEWQKTHYIHYTIDDYTKATTSKKTGKVTPSKHYYFDGILSFYDFFAIGYKFNTIKKNPNSRHGTNNTYFRHSLKMCKYLNSLNIVPFERNGRYITEDFIIEW